MFVNEIITTPRYVEGRKFVERTINSKFKKGDISITTIYMDNKPIAKQYTFDLANKIKHYWKSLTKVNPVKEIVVDKNIDVIG